MIIANQLKNQVILTTRIVDLKVKRILSNVFSKITSIKISITNQLTKIVNNVLTKIKYSTDCESLGFMFTRAQYEKNCII